MPGRAFVDTTLLVYAYDRADPAKHTRALEVLDHLATTGQGLLSVPVRAEFFWVTTRKLADPLRVEEAEQHVQAFLQAWLVVDVTPLVLLEAIRGVREHRFAFWDAQVWATALLNQIPLVLSEDFKDGLTIEGIRFLNPLSQRFHVTQIE
jgi:predicted nucleic acid-binding protein